MIRARSLTALFALTLFIGSALIFVVEPMFAKMILPLLGGSPAVWNTCVVFFQAGLLAGYAYAHVLTTRLSVRQQAITHGVLVLLAAATLPVALRPGWTPPVEGTPVPWLLLILTLGLGAPFMVVSATAPLLQKWFAGTDLPSARDPYYLYSASNVGSILALLAYPFVIEPSWSLSQQSVTWSAGYAVFAALTITCAVVAARRHVSGGFRLSASAEASAGPRRGAMREGGQAEETSDLPAEAGSHTTVVTWRVRAHWLALSIVPSSLLLGLTTYLSTDIAAVPLLWTVPLTLYLLSFVLAFAPVQVVPARLVDRTMPLLVAVLVLSIAAGAGGRILLLLIPLHLVVFFVCALHLHTALAQRRPGTHHLTEFYLWLACGGVLGGLFNTFIAPLAFNGIVEYPAAIVAACLVRSWPEGSTPRRVLRADVVLPLALGAVTLGVAYALRAQVLSAAVFTGLLTLLTLACFSFSRRPVRFGLGVAVMLIAAQLYPRDGQTLLLAERTFFGVLRVRADASTNRRVLMHGSTVHGEQSVDPARRHEPLSYYHRSGPMGQLMHALGDRLEGASIGVVGLGAGSLAAYASPGQQWTFYEIDPAVARLARAGGAFTFLRDCGPSCDVVLGDARLSLARRQASGYSLLVLDAFSSDGIPVHLLTREALELYLARLAPDGILAFHISNRHLRLQPVLAAVAEEWGLSALVQRDAVSVAGRGQVRLRMDAHGAIARGVRQAGGGSTVEAPRRTRGNARVDRRLLRRSCGAQNELDGGVVARRLEISTGCGICHTHVLAWGLHHCGDPGQGTIQ